MTFDQIKKIVFTYYLSISKSRSSKSLKEIENNEFYPALNKVCMEIVKKIMVIRDIAASSSKQEQITGEIIALLQQIFEFKEEIRDVRLKIEFLDAYVTKNFFPKWRKVDETYVTHYKEQRQKIIDLKDFFFSYTNRNAAETNKIFEVIISGKKGPNNRNKLAQTIAEKLAGHNLIGFYDFDSMKCGEEIKEKIYVACQNTVCLVQLIDEKSWGVSHSKTNWCLREYEFFSNQVEKESHITADRTYFVIQDETALVLANPKPVRDWYDRVKELKYIDDLPKKHPHKFNAKINELALAMKANIAIYVNQSIRQGLG